MKLKLIIFIFLLFGSCKPKTASSELATIKPDSEQAVISQKEQDRLLSEKKIEEENYADSIRLNKVLQDVLQAATRHINKEAFFDKFEVSQDSFIISVEIDLGFHFTKSTQHLFIRRKTESDVFIDIYVKRDSRFEKVLSHIQWEMEYMGDTIRDINGDGLKDFVVNWYGSNGCCLKGFSDVYLIRNDKKSFSDKFRFINPIFSPFEKVIRGICYGHPGDTEMYKYQWDGEKVDTVEYVSYEKNSKGEKTGKIIVTNRLRYHDNYKILKILDKAPAEYRGVHGYDWFTGNLND